MKTKVRLRTISVCLLVLCVAGALSRFSIGVNAQKPNNTKTAHPPAPPKGDSRVNPGPNNEAYAAKVKEYTTESYFMTELVDHLPLSDKVPSPDKITGYEVGAPGNLTYTKDLYRYYRELEKTSPRVKVFTAPEKSEEGKEQLLIAVGDEATLAKLGRYKDITARLADPRNVSDGD